MEDEVIPQSEVKNEGAAPADVKVETKADAAPATGDSLSGQVAEYAELEEVLKTLKPEDVLRYQRELSTEMKANLFNGDIGKIFAKYKPSVAETGKVKEMAELLKKQVPPKEPKTKAKAEVKKPDPKEPVPATTSANDELLKTKIELELLKQGVSAEFLEEATIVASAKVKSIADLAKIGEVSAKFIGLTKLPQPPQSKVGVAVGEQKRDLTEGQKAVEFLRSKNPKGFK